MGPLSSSAEQDRRAIVNKPVEVALNEIATRARVFTDASGAAIALRDGDELVTAASTGGVAPDVGARMSIEGSLTGQAILKAVTIHIEDSDKDPRVDAETCRALNTRSFIITPITGSTSMLGVLAVFATIPDAFTRTDLAVLRTMADQIASALGGGAFVQHALETSNATEEPPVAVEFATRSVEEISSNERPATSSEPVSNAALFLGSELLELDLPATIAAPVEIAPEIVPVTPVRAQAAKVSQTPPPPAPAETASSRDTRTVPVASDALAKKRPPAKEVREHTKPAEHSSVAQKESPQSKSAEHKTPSAAPQAIQWSGLSSVQSNPRPIGKIVVGVVATAVVAGAIVAALVLHKPAAETKPSSTASAPTNTLTTTAAQPNQQIATKTSNSGVSGTSAASVGSGKSSPSPAPRVQPQTQASQPAIVLARGTGRAPNSATDEAPPQLGFTGGKLALPESAPAVPRVAPRVSSEAIPAKVVRKVAPEYPEMARRARQSGNVELQAQILKDGSVGRIEVLSGATLLRPAAVEALKRWRYKPAQLGSTPVESSVKVVINFSPGN